MPVAAEPNQPAPRLSLRAAARRALRGFALAFLRARSTPLSLPSGHVLVIAPHPDDETLGCGGLLLLLRRAGQPASVLFLTDGSASHSGHPTLSPDDLARLRRSEASEAARRLGLDPASDLDFLELPDGRLPRLAPATRADAIARLVEEFARLRPALVLVTSRHDGSSEHVAAFSLVEEALGRLATRPRRLEYLVWAVYSPRFLFRVVLARGRIRRLAFPGLGPAKAHALAAHASQFSPTPPWSHPVQATDFANAFSPEAEFYLELPS